MTDAPLTDPLHQARVEAVAELEATLRRDVLQAAARHGFADPQLPDLIGAAICLLVDTLTANVDFTLRPCVIQALLAQESVVAARRGQDGKND